MTSEPISLSKPARAHLSRLSGTTGPLRTIRLFDTTIVAATPHDHTPPPTLLLPPGLSWASATTVSVADLISADPAPLPDLITLRLCIRLPLSPAHSSIIAHRLRAASLVLVDGVVFPSDVPLSAVCKTRGAHTPVSMRVFENGSDTTDQPIAPEVQTTYNNLTTIVGLDVLAYVYPDASLTSVLETVADGVAQQIDAIFTVASDGVVTITHFPVLGDGLVVTVVTSGTGDMDETTADAVAARKILHTALALPTDRPMLRRACRAFVEDGEVHGGWPGRLRDVHIGIKGHGLGSENVSVHLVDGSYLYCHYLQDRFNDSGWGCAYRSLQTLLSWCMFQRYASFRGGILPTHTEIQQALVAVGDKEETFVGSREWIGANEVCYALERLTGVQSKILHVSKGSEMGTKGRELAMHFDEHGSPVMVGGGVLAWTILGVARNEITGKTKFLILDPHYEGRDDLKAIRNKAWVAWKPEDIFQANSFYNLCMPQRPSGI